MADKTYRFRVVEKITVLKEYEVEAAHDAEAQTKAEIGDTVSETTIKTLDVVGRHVEGRIDGGDGA